MTKNAKVAVITLVIKERDGIVYACSPDMPTLHLVGNSKADVLKDAPQMIEKLYELNTGVSISAHFESAADFKPKRVSAVKETARFWATPAAALAAA